MAIKWNVAKLAAIMSALFLVPICFSETTGNLSLSEQRIVTGLWGITASTTTTTVNATATTTTVVIITGGGNTTTTIGNTTTTRITTTTSTGLTTTTSGSAGSTTTIASYTKDNLERAMTSSQVTSYIENNTALREAIESNLGSMGSSVNAGASEDVSKNTFVSKILEVGENFSKLSLKVTYKGETPVKNVIIFDVVPKTFAENADMIRVETNVQKYVVEADPSFMFVAPVMKLNDIVIIEYSIDERVGNGILNEGETAVFSGGYIEDQTFMWIAIGAFVISIFALSIAIFWNQINDMVFSIRGEKSAARKKMGFKETLKASVESLKRKFREKVLKRQEEPKFYYEHEDQSAAEKTS